MAVAGILDLYLDDLRELIAARELSSSEAVNAALARLGRLEPKLNAFITVLGEQALADANRADEEIARGHYRGPLHGVPVTIKDMFEMAGVRTTGGSKILAQWTPETDSALVERLRADAATRRSSVVVVDPEAQPSREEALRQAGANLVLREAVNPVVLEAQLQQLLNIPARRALRVPVCVKSWSASPEDAQTIEGLSLELLSGDADAAKVKRAKKVMSFLLARLLDEA